MLDTECFLEASVILIIHLIHGTTIPKCLLMDGLVYALKCVEWTILTGKAQKSNSTRTENPNSQNSDM